MPSSLDEWYEHIGSRYECVHVSNPKRRAGAGRTALGPRETYECVETQKPSGMSPERCEEVCTELYQTNAMGQTCAICQSIMTCVVGLRPCGHRFCKPCISGWAETRSNDLEPVECPTCRTPFDRDRDIYNDTSYEAAIARLHPITYGEALYDKLDAERITTGEFLEQDDVHNLDLFENDKVFEYFRARLYTDFDMDELFETLEDGIMDEIRAIGFRVPESWSAQRYYSTIIRQLIDHATAERPAFPRPAGKTGYMDPTWIILFSMVDVELLGRACDAYSDKEALKQAFNEKSLLPYSPSIFAVMQGNEEAIKYLFDRGWLYPDHILSHIVSLDISFVNNSDFFAAVYGAKTVKDLPLESIGTGIDKMRELFQKSGDGEDIFFTILQNPEVLGLDEPQSMMKGNLFHWLAAQPRASGFIRSHHTKIQVREHGRRYARFDAPI